MDFPRGPMVRGASKKGDSFRYPLVIKIRAKRSQ